MDFKTWLDLNIYQFTEIYNKFNVDKKYCNLHLGDYRAWSWRRKGKCIFIIYNSLSFAELITDTFNVNGFTLVLIGTPLNRYFILLDDNKKLENNEDYN